MFEIFVGDAKFEIYPLLDSNEVMIKIHTVMKFLGRTTYKTLIIDIEKYSKQNEKSKNSESMVDSYTLIVLKSTKYLKPADIAILFKEMFKKHKRGGPFGH